MATTFVNDDLKTSPVRPRAPYALGPEKPVCDDLHKEKLRGQLYSLLLRLDVMKQRITIHRARNDSGDMAALQQDVQSLESKTKSALLVLDGDSCHNIDDLCGEASLLHTTTNHYAIESDRIAVQDGLEKQREFHRLNEHEIQESPLFSGLAVQMAALAGLLDIMRLSDASLADVSSGGQDFRTAYAAAAASAAGSTAAANDILDLAFSAMAAEAAGAGLSVAARQARVMDAVQKMAENVAPGQTVNPGAAAQIFEQFVGEPSRQFIQNYPRYCEASRAHLGKHADRLRNHATAISERLKQHIDRLQQMVSQGRKPEEIAQELHAMEQECHHDEGFIHSDESCVRHDIQDTQKAQQAVRDLLGGISDDTLHVANLTGMSESDVREKTVDFRVAHDVQSTTPIADIIQRINETWNQIWPGRKDGGQGRSRK